MIERVDFDKWMELYNQAEEYCVSWETDTDKQWLYNFAKENRLKVFSCEASGYNRHLVVQRFWC